MRYSIDDRDILRKGKPGIEDPRSMASFPIVPFCNRIEDGLFKFADEWVELPPNVSGERDPTHGLGWLSRWSLADRNDTVAILTLTYPAAAWPWRFRTDQKFELEPDRLTLALQVTNLSDTPMPYGLGFHPYFERPVKLTATVDGLWAGDERLPDHWEGHSGFRRADTDLMFYDNTFTGWDGRAQMTSRCGTTSLHSDLRYLHVSAPKGRSVMSIQPVSAAPDAFNHPDRGVQLLDPGETVTTEMRLDHSPDQ